MKAPGHLRIEEVKLLPGQEWRDQAEAWRFVRVTSGAAYWLEPARPRAISEGELLVAAPRVNAVVRASQLNEVVLHGFNFAPDLLCGFFSLAERHFFDTGEASPGGPVQFLPSTHPVTQRFELLIAQHEESPGLVERAEVLGLAASFFSDGMSRHRLPSVRSLSAQQRFQQIISQMPDIEIIQHTPEQLAELCRCSPRHFNRLFREHFNESPRARQTELRLLKARQLLTETDAKVLQIALDSGYRSLSLFNFLFRRRFGMSPSEWRQKAAKLSGKADSLLALLAGLAVLFASFARAAELDSGSSAPEFSSPPAAATNAPEDRLKAQEALRKKMADLEAQERAAKAARGHLRAGAAAGVTNATPAVTSTNGPTFEVRGYELAGNTLLPPAITEPILQKHTGPAVTFDSIRQALSDLQMAYRERGFVTVAVSLPPQQLTNGIVKVQATEGRLVEINIRNNRYFSSNNVMRELPSLRTNLLLNALIFQQELDRANANRDRQIYPVLGPGPDPGTSMLDLKVKDRLPLHVHLDINDYSTPNTPELRANFAAVYNNLWQLNHQFGAQYSFSPEAYKAGNNNFYDQPLIANYSAFYRLPFAGVNGPERQSESTLSAFGYDEATRRFRAPPPSGTSELLFYASRSFSDTGQQLASDTLTPDVLPPEGGLQISDRTYNRTLNPNEDVGVRFSKPLQPFWGISSSLSAGLDYKNYRSTLIQSRTFQASIFVPDFGSTGPPFTEFPSPAVSAEREVFNAVRYLPVSLNWEASAADAFGQTSFSLGQSFNWAGLLSGKDQFQAVTGSSQSSGSYYVITAGFTREQKLYADWGVRLHADGQWANEPLITNEQFSLGGQAGPRGYRDGTEYGDSGWRLQFEPHSPYWNLGLAFDKVPIIVRAYTFADYGERYLLDPGSRAGTVSMLGLGTGMDLSMGEHFDCRVSLGVPLLRTPLQERGHPRVSFSVAAQW